MNDLAWVLITLLASFVFAELVGYMIHVLLHSQKVEFLSRNHMIHHLKVYGPKMPQRPGAAYRGSVENRAAVLGVGMEWIGPVATVVALIVGISHWLTIPALYTGVFTTGSLSWGYFLFGYMHDNMHLKDFWMEKTPILGSWFLRIRKLHDIHHLHIDDEGKMSVNYGICFFFFDRLIGSYKKEFSKFNEPGYQEAIRKYQFIENK